MGLDPERRNQVIGLHRLPRLYQELVGPPPRRCPTLLARQATPLGGRKRARHASRVRSLSDGMRTRRDRGRHSDRNDAGGLLMVPLAEAVIAQRLNYAAVGDRAGAIGGHHAAQLASEALQLADFRLHGHQLLLRQGVGVAASPLGIVGEVVVVRGRSGSDLAS